MPELRRTDRGFDRVINFTDAVVAIAITLLVLPLTDLVAEAQAAGAYEVMGEHLNQFIAFALTFAVTAIYWFRHHTLFELVGSYDSGLMRLNMLWLLFVVLLPFASGLVGEYGFERGNGVVYCGLMAVLSLLLGMMTSYVRSRPHLLRPELLASDVHGRAAWAFAIFFTALALLATIQPGLASWLLLLLFPLGRLFR